MRIKWLVVSVLVLVFLLNQSVISMAARQVSDTDDNFWSPLDPPKARYIIDGEVDGKKGVLSCKETIRFKNNTGKSINVLAIDYPEYLGKVDFQVMGQVLRNIGSGTPVQRYRSIYDDNSSLHLYSLPQALLSGESLEITASFQFDVGIGSEGNRPGIGLIHWHPKLWWGSSSQDDYDVRIRAPKEYTIAASGVYDSKTGWYHGGGIRSFGFIMLTDMKVLEAKSGDVTIRCFYPEDGVECARQVLDTAVDSVNFYRKWLGFYPSKCLYIIPSDGSPGDGHPVATGIVAVHGMNEEMNDANRISWQHITAHEIGHQYWGECVMEKDSPDWLWIGMGIYADREYIRARGIKFNHKQEFMDRYIKGVNEGLDTTVALSYEQVKSVNIDRNNIVVHGKGFSIISALDSVLGNDTFDRIYRRCLKRFKGRCMGVREFQAVCEDESRQDLDWFFEQWVHSNRYLSYYILSQDCVKDGDGYISSVTVKCRGNLLMPVPVAAYFEDGTHQVKVTDRLMPNQVLKFRSHSQLKDVRIDPEDKLANIVPPPPMTMDELMARLDASVWTLNLGDDASYVLKEAERLKLDDPQRWYTLAMNLYFAGCYEEALSALKRSEGIPVIGRFITAWKGVVLDALGRRQEAIDNYKHALETFEEDDRSDTSSFSITRQWLQDRLITPYKPDIAHP